MPSAPIWTTAPFSMTKERTEQNAVNLALGNHVFLNLPPPKKDTRTVKFNSDGRSRLMQGLSHRITCHACKSTGPKFVLLGKTSTPRSDQFNSLALSSWETLINRILLMTRTHYQSVSVHLNTRTSHRGR